MVESGYFFLKQRIRGDVNKISPKELNLIIRNFNGTQVFQTYQGLKEIFNSGE